MKAIVLFSGGLDSLLAVRILQEQGAEVIALNVITPFHNGVEEARRRAEELQIELVVRRFGDEYLTMLGHPKFGIGKGYNPCIDCRILMARAAKELMLERGADFVATGEVAGQRPNSQMIHQLGLVTRESGLGGKLVRPLSAKVLPPTDPENDGLLDRDQLFSHTGRGRTGLMFKARNRYGLKNIPQPSTGCLLCEQSFAPRVRDLIRYNKWPTDWDARTLIPGRHFRIDSETRGVVSRREADGNALFSLFAEPLRRRSILLSPKNFNGPTVLLVGNFAPSRSETTIDESQVVPTPDSADFPKTVGDYLSVAEGLLLRFSNPEKLAALTDPPLARFFYGADVEEERQLARHPFAESLPMIREADKKKKKTAKEEAPNSDSPF